MKSLIQRKLKLLTIIRHLSTHFEVLGIDKDATIQDIKRSFYKKAKLLHPDVVNQNIPLKEANRKFIELKLAYDILSDTDSRINYLTELSRSKYNKNNNYKTSDPHTQQDNNSSNYENDDHPNNNFTGINFNENNKKKYGFKRRYKYKDLASYKNDWNDFKIELESAIDKAYFGPYFHLDNRCEYPEQFEVEIRKQIPDSNNNTNNNEIMHIVSGRQKLGYVYIPSNLALSSQQIDNNINNDNNNTHQQELYLHYGSSLYLKGIRTLNKDNNHYSIILKKLNNLNSTNNNNNTNDINDIWDNNDDNNNIIGKIIKTEKFDILFDNNQNETHRIINFYLPGVDNIYFQSSKGFVELKISKAMLLPEFLWLWEPRDKEFTGGSWYFETNKGGQYSRMYRQNKYKNENDIKNNFIASYDEKQHLDVGIAILYCAFKEFDSLIKNK